MLVTNFSGGEVSKNLYGRIDLPLYACSVSRLENFDVIPTGGIKRRCGTERLGKLKGRARLIPFEVNSSLSFIFEFGCEYVRIWKNGRQLLLAGSPLEFRATEEFPLYKASEIFDVQYAQTFDSVYLTHRHYKPYCIKWQGGDSFTLGSLSIKGNAHDLPFQEKENYPGCVAVFSGRLILASSLKEPQKIWASKVFEYENFTYFDTVVSSSTQLKNPDLRVFSAKAKKDSKVLTELTKDFTGIKNIENYYVSGHKGVPAGTKVVSVTADTMTLSNAVKEDKEDMVLSIHLWKDTENPSNEDYQKKEIINKVTTPAHAFYFELGSDKNDAVKWLTASKDLIIGTEASEWIMGEGVTAVNVSAHLNSRYGVSSFQGALVGRSIIYISAGGRAVKDYAYDYEERTYRSIDLTQAAEHLLKDYAAKDFDYTNIPYPKIYVTRADGCVCVLTYDRGAGLSAWSRIVLGSGAVRNVACVQQDGADEVYFEVEKDGVFYLERLKEDSGFFLDGFKRFTADTGTADYEGAFVYVSAEKKLFPLSRLPDEYKTFEKQMYIGFKYESLVESLPVINDGQNSKKRIVKLLIRFLDSALPFVSQEGGAEEVIPQKEPFSGVVSVPVQGSFERDVFFKLRLDKAEACTVSAVNAQVF